MPYRKCLITGLMVLTLAVLGGTGAYYATRSNLTDGLAVARQTDALCAEQAVCYHLGIADGYVAVYEGPLGRDGRVLRVERIRTRDLAPECRRRLEQAMDFAAQTPETQARLRRDFEFETGAALHAVLENLDELQD